MYSPDEQEEYTPKAATPVGVPHFPIQELKDVLTEVPDVQLLPSIEFALQLKVMMANCPGCPHPPAFLCNTGMVMHMLKSNLTLRDLEHIQVDGPGMASLFFFDKQGQCRLTHEATQAMQEHVREAFMKWISCFAHFAMNPLPLVEGWHNTVVTSEQCRHCLHAEYQGQVIPALS